MTAAKHTPGPWTVPPDSPADILAPDGQPVAVARGWLWRQHPECIANAHLIAAAPDMLEALREIALTPACSNSDPDDMGDALDSIIGRAQGILARLKGVQS